MENKLERRLLYRFDYFFNAGVDKETGLCDVEGSDVYINRGNRWVGRWEYAGSVNYMLPEEMYALSDRELETVLDQNNIHA